MQATDTEAEIAVVKSQLVSIQKAIDEVKLAVTDLISIKTDVAVMQERQLSHDLAIKSAVQRVDKLEAAQKENTEYINKTKGASSLTVTILGIVQAVVLAGGSWLVSTVIDSQSQVKSIQTSMARMEAAQERIINALVRNAK